MYTYIERKKEKEEEAKYGKYQTTNYTSINSFQIHVFLQATLFWPFLVCIGLRLFTFSGRSNEFELNK